MTNPVTWFEIPVAEMDRAITFYAAVFGWQFDRQTVDGYDMAFLPGVDGAAGASGALAKGDVYRPAKAGPILYFRVSSIDATLSRATIAGATILYPKKEVPGVGFVAEFEDSEGNRIALMEPHPLASACALARARLHAPMPDSRALRDAFGCFATGVTIITTWDEAGRAMGFTANSFTSVSLDPPLLLVCPAKTASVLPALRHTQRFGVSVLSTDQQAIAERFAMRGIDRFAEGAWVEAESGVLLLEGACANFACTIDGDVEAGDHVVLIGRIDSFRAAPERRPLLYLKGRYTAALA